jgi:hypothetical protein
VARKRVISRDWGKDSRRELVRPTFDSSEAGNAESWGSALGDTRRPGVSCIQVHQGTVAVASAIGMGVEGGIST